jgi:hypothetical protein
MMRAHRLLATGLAVFGVLAGGFMFSAVPALAVGAPVVEGESFTSVTSSGVTLQAQVNPEEQDTSCVFQYGTEESLTNSTSVPCEPAVLEGSGGQGVSANISGLGLGTTYYYRAVAENAAHEKSEGPVEHFTTLGTLPIVSTGTVSGIGQSSANATGTVAPEGGETYYYYQYGPTTEYGQRTSPGELGVDIGSGLNSVQAPGILVPLTPGVTYHYRLIAWNEYGTSYGQDETFTALAGLPPSATTGPASGVSTSEATLSGTINPQTVETSYRFEYGTNTEYGTQAFGTAVPEQGIQTVTLSLRGLDPNTTYHYRLVATSPAGTSYGEDETFTTPGILDPLVFPTTAPLVAPPTIAFPVEAKGTKTKSLTNAQKLANALKACKKEKKSKRAKCEKQAHKQFGPTKKVKKK